MNILLASIVVVVVIGYRRSAPKEELYSTGKLPIPRHKEESQREKEEYTIYVGSFTSQNKIREIASSLKSMGITPMVRKTEGEFQEKTIIIGPFGTKEEMENAMGVISGRFPDTPLAPGSGDSPTITMGPIPKNKDPQAILELLKNMGFAAKLKVTTAKRPEYRIYAGRFSSLTKLQNTFQKLREAGINPVSIQRIPSP